MGAWGVGLYANDVAADLRSTIASVLRLPLSVDEVLGHLLDVEPSLADPADESYTDAWFVVADRFHRYGIQHEPTIDLVERLIRDGVDLDRKEELGLDPVDLRARSKVLAQLQQRLAAPHPKPFKTGTLKKPQAFVLDAGDVVAYPTMGGESANPYFKDWASERFVPDGFAVALVAERGLTFGYLAWYTVTVLDAIWPSVPSLDECMGERVGQLAAGTLSRSHLGRLAVEHLARVEIVALPERTWSAAHPDKSAISDISISNCLTRPNRFNISSRKLEELTRPS